MSVPDDQTTGWAATIVAAIFGWWNKTLHNRITHLERDGQTSEKAQLDRAELRQDLRDLAARTDQQLERVFERFDDLSDQIRKMKP